MSCLTFDVCTELDVSHLTSYRIPLDVYLSNEAFAQLPLAPELKLQLKLKPKPKPELLDLLLHLLHHLVRSMNCVPLLIVVLSEKNTTLLTSSAVSEALVMKNKLF